MTVNPYAIDANEPGRVRGWYIDLQTRAPARLWIVADGSRLFAVSPSAYRPDVLASGLPSAFCGFDFHFDGAIFQGYESVVIQDDQHNLLCEVSQESTSDSVGPVAFHVDAADLLGISGWSFIPGSRSPLYIKVYSGGDMISSGTSNLTRQDVAQKFGALEACGFQIPFLRRSAASAAYLVFSDSFISRLSLYDEDDLLDGDGDKAILLPFDLHEITAVRSEGGKPIDVEAYSSAAFLGKAGGVVILLDSSRQTSISIETDKGTWTVSPDGSNRLYQGKV